MLGHRQLSAAEYLGIWRRRRKWTILCCLLGAAVGYGMARVLPAKYTSSATVLVEEPRGSSPEVNFAATEPPALQLRAMQEKILSGARMEPLIERFGLYPLKRSREEAVAELRRNIAVAPIKLQSSSVNPAPTGFTISFTADYSKLAQQVCTEMVSWFIQEDIQESEPQAREMADILTKPVEEAKRKVNEQDARLAAFKRRHAAELAADYGINLENSLFGYRTKLDATNAALKRALQDRASLSEAILAQQEVPLQGLKRDTTSTQALEQQLATEQAQLVTLEARYTPDHPDVVKLRTDIAQLRKKIEEAQEAASHGPARKTGAAPGNEPPQVAQLQAQIHDLDLIVQEKTREQGRLQQEIQASQARLDNGTIVEREYKDLTREYAVAKGLYESALAKQNDAQRRAELGQPRPGGRFRVVDPPNLPALPSSPNPILFTLGGAGGGLILGMLVVLAGGVSDKTLRTEGDIEHFLDLPTLAIIPQAGTPDGNKGDSADGSWRDLGKRGQKEEGVLTDV